MSEEPHRICSLAQYSGRGLGRGAFAIAKALSVSGPFFLREKARMRAVGSNGPWLARALSIPALTQPLPEGEEQCKCEDPLLDPLPEYWARR
jgi:hypothetical protein